MTVGMVALGTGGPRVSRVGLGLMGMSGVYGPADEAESIATIRAALEAGVTLLDTGDFYGMGHNELLLRDALRGVDRSGVFIQVKFGAQRDPGGAFAGYDASPAAVKNSLAYSLTRLGTDYVDLYQPARLDPKVPVEDTVGAIADLIQAGYVRYAGLSEMGADTIRRAAAVYPVSALQIEYSLMSRGIEASVLPAVRELGISVTAYGILSRGLLSAGARQLGDSDPRRRFPRFQGENLSRNLGLLAAVEQLADAAGATPASSRSPGRCPAATTSSRSSGPSAGTGWRRLSARSSCGWGRGSWPRWRPPSRPRRWPATVTTRAPWPRWTVSGTPGRHDHRAV